MLLFTSDSGFGLVGEFTLFLQPRPRFGFLEMGSQTVTWHELTALESENGVLFRAVCLHYGRLFIVRPQNYGGIEESHFAKM